MTHTPGPWHQDPFVDAIHIKADDGSMIADISDRKGIGFQAKSGTTRM
jgi:hypothetical protein